MNTKEVLEFLPWFAIAILSIGYWSQVWKIHQHKEVRDLSIVSYSCLALGFMIMSWKAYNEGTVIFLVKQLMTLLPVSIVIYQIWKHQGDSWHEKDAKECHQCHRELEVSWRHCPGCGELSAPTADTTLANLSPEHSMLLPARSPGTRSLAPHESVPQVYVERHDEQSCSTVHLHVQIQLQDSAAQAFVKPIPIQPAIVLPNTSSARD